MTFSDFRSLDNPLFMKHQKIQKNLSKKKNYGPCQHKTWQKIPKKEKQSKTKNKKQKEKYLGEVQSSLFSMPDL